MQSFSCLDQCPSEQQCYLESVQKDKKDGIYVYHLCIRYIVWKSFDVIKHQGIGGIRGPVTNKSIYNLTT